MHRIFPWDFISAWVMRICKPVSGGSCPYGLHSRQGQADQTGDQVHLHTIVAKKMSRLSTRVPDLWMRVLPPKGSDGSACLSRLVPILGVNQSLSETKLAVLRYSVVVWSC